MNERKITTIPATINRFTATPLTESRKRKTAGYARVSTDHEDQISSYAAQVDYYTNYIKSREDWEFVKVFTDEGISATSTAKREGFKKMVSEALAGNISLIITKSVSRFARNTVDSLTTIRKLKENGIEVYFEKENIWTFDSKGELLLTIMSSLAQEEARSISENVTWGHRKRFSDGKVYVPFGRFLGYDRGENGELIINEEQAIIVRRIYKMFLDGNTPHTIAKALTDEGIPTPGGKKNWGATTVKSILSNEKYKGDALLQKSYTVDFLTKKKKANEGEIPQYYVEGSHKGIISTEVFELTQIELERRKSGDNRHSGMSIFASKIKCGCCGSWYGSKIWHSNSKYKRTIYQCNHKFKNGEKCTTPHLYEEQIKTAFITAVNKLISDKKRIISDFLECEKVIFDMTEIENERDKLTSELAVTADLIQKIIAENARIALDQTEYQKRYDSLVEQFETTKSRLSEVEEQLSQKRSRKEIFRKFITDLEKQENLLTEFNEEIWCSLVDFVTVGKDGKLTFAFKNEVTIEV
jgi:DNA invertase Pin-like site-specific DNA recombinase